jgi:hypothetical protein
MAHRIRFPRREKNLSIALAMLVLSVLVLASPAIAEKGKLHELLRCLRMIN